MPASPSPPRVLLLTSQYFLMGEIKAACERTQTPHLLLDLNAREMDLDRFVGLLGEAVAALRPHFVLTVNHLGVDREGVLLELLARQNLPLASWFVDNPFLILPVYPPRYLERTALFSWDADNVAPLRAMGFAHVSHLPLAADAARFVPGIDGARPGWRARVSFVGNSMVRKVRGRLEAAAPSPALAARVEEIAAAFGPSESRSPAAFLLERFPGLAGEFAALGSPARKLAFETLVTWRSTLDYRLDCVRRLLPFHPLIAGDDGWRELLPAEGWTAHPELGYYEDLPAFYPASEINFNCTSLQMKGAVNQRVFDVPSAGAFLLTDHRRQMERLFEPGEEIIAYRHPDEIPGLVERWLADPEGRARIAAAARRRILAEHTYDHRLAGLCAAMDEAFDLGMSGGRP
jgi:spore maturation protein CgeB